MDHHEVLTRALNAHVVEVLPHPTPLDPARLLSARLSKARPSEARGPDPDLFVQVARRVQLHRAAR